MIFIGVAAVGGGIWMIRSAWKTPRVGAKAWVDFIEWVFLAMALIIGGACIVLDPDALRRSDKLMKDIKRGQVTSPPPAGYVPGQFQAVPLPAN